MAIVVLALNGGGLGHLVRSLVVCDTLERAGERPIIFSQGIYPLDDPPAFPGLRIPSLWKASENVRRRVAAQIQTTAEISLPAVLVEDTHPNPIALPPHIRRVLLVRPPSFEYLEMLNEKYASTFATFVLCDEPGSPSWPYSAEETRTIEGWSRWTHVGPLYRRASSADIAEVRTRYAITPEQRLCVFTMGGGGQHPPHLDAKRFTALSAEIADTLLQHANTRLLFVRGPYFPPDVAIDSRFEVVAQEPQMPALLAAADGAVIRAGFNTTWECVSAGTPFLPFIGDTYGEPTAERLDHFAALGLLPPNTETFWSDAQWRAAFKQSCARLVARWPGRPDPERLSALVLGAPAAHRPSAIPMDLRVVPRRNGHAIPFIIRIDDVVTLEPALVWLLTLLCARGWPASLEVVPYLADFNDRALHTFDPSAQRLEVGQHGYAHLARQDIHLRPHEFNPAADAPTPEEGRTLAWGIQRIRERFPARFTGGFSPPFDAIPCWLPEHWRGLGGAFISAGRADVPASDSLPVIPAALDVWSWRRDELQPNGEVFDELARWARTHGHAGIILHPHRFRTVAAQRRLLMLLDGIEREGYEVVPMRTIVARRNSPSARTHPTQLRRLLHWVNR